MAAVSRDVGRGRDRLVSGELSLACRAGTGSARKENQDQQGGADLPGHSRAAGDLFRGGNVTRGVRRIFRPRAEMAGHARPGEKRRRDGYHAYLCSPADSAEVCGDEVGAEYCLLPLAYCLLTIDYLAYLILKKWKMFMLSMR